MIGDRADKVNRILLIVLVAANMMAEELGEPLFSKIFHKSFIGTIGHYLREAGEVDIYMGLLIHCIEDLFFLQAVLFFQHFSCGFRQFMVEIKSEQLFTEVRTASFIA